MNLASGGLYSPSHLVVFGFMWHFIGVLVPSKTPPHPVGKKTELSGTAYLNNCLLLFAANHRTDGHSTIRNLWTRLVACSIAPSTDWYQPLNPNKTELIVYYTAVQCPRLNVYYDGTKITQKNGFKYLGFLLDSKLSFRGMIEAQFIKLRKAYVILKYIHRQFPSFNHLKLKFFNTYVWPHLYMLSTIYCMFSTTSRDRVAAFYRRCMRLIYQLFRCPTQELHSHFKLPTIEQRFKKSLLKRMTSIQRHESSLIDYTLQFKHLRNIMLHHYRVKPCIKYMPQGRPSKRFLSLLDTDISTFFDLLCEFVLT